MGWRIVRRGRAVRSHLRLSIAIGAAIVAALAVAPSAVVAAGPFEPNDSYITATGPITAGTTYTGAYETSNDADYFYFYLPQLTQLQFGTTNSTSKEIYLCSHIDHQLPGEVDSVAGSYLTVYGGESKTGAVTLERGKYYYVLDCPGTIGKAYSFSLSPAGVTSTYEPFALACAAAHPAVVSSVGVLAKAKKKLKAAKQRLAAGRHWQPAHKRHARAKIVELRDLVESSFGAFNAASENERSACSVPQ
jgi:hypothetical protein